MIKEVPVELWNKYLCDGCKRYFKTKEAIEIKPFRVVCSKKCEFKVIYELVNLMGYSDENLELMQKTIEKREKIEEFNRNEAIFTITKHYAKMGLPNITIVVPSANIDLALPTNKHSAKCHAKTPLIGGWLGTQSRGGSRSRCITQI